MVIKRLIQWLPLLQLLILILGELDAVHVISYFPSNGPPGILRTPNSINTTRKNGNYSTSLCLCVGNSFKNGRILEQLWLLMDQGLQHLASCTGFELVEKAD
jgi:hypothetical protein